MKKYLIVGAGHQGLAMAAHLALNGEKVNLWNRTASNISEIIKSKQVHCKGVFNGTAILNKVSSNIDEVMEKIILVATPADAHRDVARMLARKVDSTNIIILNPGRTFGAIEFRNILIEEGCNSIPMIAETQTIVYTCRKENNNTVNIFAMKKDVMISALNKDNMEDIFSNIPECLKPYFKIEESILKTSLSNVGQLLHCAPTLMNIGWIENKNYKFKYYIDGITPTIVKYIENMDKERILIGKKLGISLETINQWFERTYNVKGNLLECINNEAYKEVDAPTTIECRYLNEDIPFGLVPLERVGKLLEIDTPYISEIINIASLIMEKNYRDIGRKIDKKDFENLKGM